MLTNKQSQMGIAWLVFIRLATLRRWQKMMELGLGTLDCIDPVVE